MQRLELYISEIIRGERSNIFLRPFLWFLSKLFGVAVFCKNFAYKAGFLKPKKIPALVISVGNISCGGTGKTPFVKFLSQTFENSAILSRGYRSKIENKNVKIASGNGPLFDPEYCGDEPFFLAQTTKSHIWVGKNRILSARQACAEGFKFLILDDGLQYRKLHQDIKIITVDGNDPLGKKAFLPKGWLRDSLERLKEADLIVINNVKDKNHFLEVSEILKKYTNRPIAGAEFILKNLDAWKGRKVSAFCGIAKPKNFFKALEEAEIKLVRKHIVPDHKSLNINDLSLIAKEGLKNGAEALLCTEKDFVKIKNHEQHGLPIFPIFGNLAIKYGNEQINNLIDKILRFYGD